MNDRKHTTVRRWMFKLVVREAILVMALMLNQAYIAEWTVHCCTSFVCALNGFVTLIHAPPSNTYSTLIDPVVIVTGLAGT